MIFDEHRLEQLFRSHFTGLCRFAAGFVKDEEIAKEIVQDAFVSLWMKRDTIDPENQVKSYLSTTVRNKCLNFLRDNKKFSSNLLDLEGFNGSDSYAQSDPLVIKEMKQRISTATAELPEKCREIFLLNRNGNLKYQQIADQLGISVKTVETQMSKALQHMRKRLAEFIYVLLLIISHAGSGYIPF
jgi:RNA polymerase sigma-70 factor (ECF subfamily)